MLTRLIRRFAPPLSSAAKRAKQKEVKSPSSQGAALPNGSRSAVTALNVDTSADPSLYSSRPAPQRALSSRSPNGSASGSRPLVVRPTTPAPPTLAGVEEKLDAIRSHVINSLAARKLGEKGIACEPSIRSSPSAVC